jgi:hypothetical protein
MHHARLLMVGNLPIDGKVGAASAVHPYALVVVTPGLTLNAGRTAALIDEPNPPSRPCLAKVISAVVRGAGNYPSRRRRRRRVSISGSGTPVAAAEHEVGPTSAIDPGTGSVISPGLVLNAGRTAALIHHAYSVPRVHITVVTSAVVGGAGKIAPVLIGHTTLGGSELSTDGEKDHPKEYVFEGLHSVSRSTFAG